MYVVTVIFTIHSEYWSAFTKAIQHNAKLSISLEPGCSQFDVCEGESGKYTIFLYEVYKSQSDFTAHMCSHHFLQFNAETSDWVADKKVQIFTRMTTEKISLGKIV